MTGSGGLGVGMARSVMIFVLSLLVGSLGVYWVSHGMYMVWSVVPYIVTTMVLFTGVYSAVMLGVSLSSVGWCVHWYRSDSSATNRAFMFCLVVNTLVGMGATAAVMTGGENPVLLPLALLVSVLATAPTAARAARRDYYLAAVDPAAREGYLGEGGNWAKNAARYVTRSIVPRWTGDYTRFAAQGILVLVHFLVVFAATLAFGVYPVYNDPGSTSVLSLAVALVVATSVLYWFGVALCGRLLGQWRQGRLGSVSLSPCVYRGE